MGDANPIRTLGDYSNPSHKGYRNTIELPIGIIGNITLFLIPENDFSMTFLLDNSSTRLVLIGNSSYGRKAHLLENKQTLSVGVFDEAFSTWVAFGGNTRDLGSFGEETDKITELHRILEDLCKQWLETASQA
ncbi:hypothetical protein Tco_1101583 [Tanacetum coccineum]